MQTTMKRICKLITMLALLTAGATKVGAQNTFDDQPIENVPTVSQPTTKTTVKVKEQTGDKGLVFKYGKLHYKIRSKNTVEVTGEVRSVLSGRVEIPNIVKHKDVTYKVVGIGKSAFYGLAKMTEVVIPKSIQYIESMAFALTGLKEVIIPGDNVAVKKRAFMNCKDLTVATLNGKKPKCSSSAFELCFRMKELRIRGVDPKNNGKKLPQTNAVIKVIK